MNQEKLNIVLQEHKKWLENKEGKRANLRHANLTNTNLRHANLCYAYLTYADLSNAKLPYADLTNANLTNAKLLYADLSNANLTNANLLYADLSNANLSNANLPSPTMLLLAYWGRVSPELCTELMRYDADNHPNKKAFTVWAKGGNCPYSEVPWQRCANFQEEKEYWKPGKCKMSALQLVEALFKEKDITR